MDFFGQLDLVFYDPVTSDRHAACDIIQSYIAVGMVGGDFPSILHWLAGHV